MAYSREARAGTNQTPSLLRWAGNVLRALYEKKLTLVEAEFLIDRVEKRVRYAMTADLRDKPQAPGLAVRRQPLPPRTSSRKSVARSTAFSASSEIKLCARCSASHPCRSIWDGPRRKARSILVSLAHRARQGLQREWQELFATLLLSDLWTAAQERGKRDGVKPFYCYLDEFQRFISPTISDNLDEARGFGLHLTMAHQFPNQLLDRGENGKRVYNSIMENASSKVVFRLSHEENLESNGAVALHGRHGHGGGEARNCIPPRSWNVPRVRCGRAGAEAGAAVRGGGTFSGTTGTEGIGGAIFDEEEQDAGPMKDPNAESAGESSTRTDSESESETLNLSAHSGLLERELSHVQVFAPSTNSFSGRWLPLWTREQRHGVARASRHARPRLHRDPRNPRHALHAGAHQKVP